MNYQPRLVHATLTTFIAIALFSLSTIARGNVFVALVAGSCIFLTMTAVVINMVAYGHRYDTAISFIESYIRLDPGQREELGYHLPSLRLVARRGRAVQLFEDTRATAEHIRLFLVDSSREYVSAERDWNTAERPRWAWQEIYDWLVRNEKVYADSASGTHSYKWVGASYEAMMFYFVGSSVPDLNATGIPTAVYASESHSPTASLSRNGSFEASTHARGGGNGNGDRGEVV